MGEINTMGVMKGKSREIPHMDWESGREMMIAAQLRESGRMVSSMAG